MKQVHTLDRVVIRFAGDSGDGMQLTGDRFTADSAIFGNDISTLPNFPAEIRAPAGTLPGVSSFQLHFANYDIMTPGDRPDVLVAMNPAALKANIADLPRGGADHRRHRRLHQAQPGQGRLRRQPAGGRLAGRLPAARARPDRDDRRGGQGVRAVPQGRLPRQEHVRARPAVLALPPARPRARSTSSAPSSPASPRSATPTSPRSRPATRSARRPRSSRSPTRSRRRRCRPGSYRQISGNLALAYGLDHRAPARPGCRCSSAPTRSPRPPTCCTS